MERGHLSYQEWKEKRDERKAERELARAEKEAGLSDESLFAEAPAPPVFLDYDNPNAATAAGTRAEGNRGEGWSVSGDLGTVDLPASVGELTNSYGSAGGLMANPVFQPDGADEGVVAAAALDPDLIRAWAGSIAQVTGASLSEPLITAALHASMGAPEPVAAPAPTPTEPISLRRNTAAAFAGRESTGLRTSEHEADWSTRQ
jgi:hypothetical protein